MPYQIREGGDDCPFEVAKERTPIEWRTAQLEDVNRKERIIRCVAVPYEQRTKVPIDGEVWDEMFLYTAFNELGQQARQRFSVNRDHDKLRTVGRVINYDLHQPQGLIIESRISPTELGEETLILAADDALGGSVGFQARRTDCIWDRRTMTRSVKRAYLDHLAFVPDPAYEGAQVLSVRSSVDDPYGGHLPTPGINEFLADPLVQWMDQRVEPPHTD